MLDSPTYSPAPGAPVIASPLPALRIDGGRRLDLAAFDGQPVVLAFLDLPADGAADVRAGFGPALDQARAELRGLGAILLLIARRGLWCFSPDDELELFAAPDTLRADEVAALRAWLGGETTGNALFVLDGQRAVRLAQAITVDAMT